MLILERLGSMINIHMPEKEGGETLITAACKNGNLAIVKFLMSLGAQVTHEIEVFLKEQVSKFLKWFPYWQQLKTFQILYTT